MEVHQGLALVRAGSRWKKPGEVEVCAEKKRNDSQ